MKDYWLKRGEASCLNEDSHCSRIIRRSPGASGNTTGVQDRQYWMDSHCLPSVLKKLNFKNLLSNHGLGICFSNKREEWKYCFECFINKGLMHISKDHLLLFLLTLPSKFPTREDPSLDLQSDPNRRRVSGHTRGSGEKAIEACHKLYISLKSLLFRWCATYILIHNMFILKNLKYYCKCLHFCPKFWNKSEMPGKHFMFFY